MLEYVLQWSSVKKSRFHLNPSPCGTMFGWLCAPDSCVFASPPDASPFDRSNLVHVSLCNVSSSNGVAVGDVRCVPSCDGDLFREDGHVGARDDGQRRQQQRGKNRKRISPAELNAAATLMSAVVLVPLAVAIEGPKMKTLWVSMVTSPATA